MACKDNNLDLSHYITLFARTERGQDPSASATCDSMQLGKTRVSVEEHQCHCGQEGHCCATCKEKPAPRSAKADQCAAHNLETLVGGDIGATRSAFQVIMDHKNLYQERKKT
ncbi:uncharacterized [Tachysurus ichikawai]